MTMLRSLRMTYNQGTLYDLDLLCARYIDRYKSCNALLSSVTSASVWNDWRPDV